MDFFMNESKSDVVFVVEGQQLPALKLILSLKSEVFRAMFSDNFKESEDKEVVIKDTTFDAFKTMIEFLYCDRLVLKDKTDLLLIEEVSKLCDEYQALRLKKRIGDHLKTITVTLENLGTVSRIAIRYRFKEICEIVMAFIDSNFDTISANNVNDLVETSEATHYRLIDILVNNYREVRANSDQMRAELTQIRRGQCNECNTIYPVAPELQAGLLQECLVCKKYFNTL